MAAVVGALALMIFSRCLAPDLVYPLERAWHFAGRSLWPRVAGVFRASAAAAENEALRREVASLLVLRSDLARLEGENARLRQVLDYRARSPKKWVCAGVLSRGGGAVAVRDMLRVDKGAVDGVGVGAVVVAPEGLVGRVSSVSARTAEVTLLTDASLKVACEVRSASVCARGILAGGGGDRLVLHHLRNGERVAPRSVVVTSGLGGVFPQGLEVGVLLAVTNGVRGIEGDVQAKVDYQALEDVFISCDR